MITLFLEISQSRMMGHYLPKLVRALESLDKKQLWLKESEKMNSIGGITLHIGEHLNRHIVRFHTPDAVFPMGIESHFPEIDQEPAAIILIMMGKFNEWSDQLTRQIACHNEEELRLEVDMHSIYHLVEHTGYHLGQIIDRTQRLTDMSFEFCQNGLNEKSLRK